MPKRSQSAEKARIVDVAAVQRQWNFAVDPFPLKKSPERFLIAPAAPRGSTRRVFIFDSMQR
jgi:hypothetical protein